MAVPTAATPVAGTAPITLRPTTRFADFWSDFRRSWIALTALVLIVLLLVLAFGAPWIMPQNPYDLRSLSFLDAFKAPGTTGSQGYVHLLGTDNVGRDMLSAIFYGLRTSFIQLGLTAIFISHDLSVVRHVCDRVAIMYLGRVVEMAPAGQLYDGPLHPYTRALFASIPTLGTGRAAFQPIEGEIPSPVSPPPGCHFHPRCPFAGPRCRAEAPRLAQAAQDHSVACHLHDGGTGA